MFNFLSKKKKGFKATCQLSNSPVEKESAYLLSTAQIISSRKFWDNIMTEPDTMTYTEAHFKSGDKTATNIRSMIFKKYSSEDKAWVVSDAQMHLFEVDEQEAKSLANRWWDSEGQEVPDELNNSLTRLGDGAFKEIQDYAVMDAGRARVAV